MKSKTKISSLEAERLAACRVEFSLHRKIMRALQSRRINAGLISRLCDKQTLAMRAIAAAEDAIREQKVIDHVRSILTMSLT